MRHQLKAVFDDRGKAQQALDTLLRSGYASADTLVVPVSRANVGKPGGVEVPGWRKLPGTSGSRFLSQLLAYESKHRPRTAASLHATDSYVLILATGSDAEAERATSLIPRFRHGVHGDPVSGPCAEPAGAAPGTQDSVIRDADQAGTTGKAGDSTLPAGHWPGTPLHAPVPGTSRTGDPDGSIEALRAYRFGHDMHENGRYRNRSWNEAAGDLKVLWEAHAPAGRQWESSAPAIRLGWNSSSPEIDDDSYHRSHWKTTYATSPTDPGAARRPKPEAAAVAPASTWKSRHPGELTAWENFIDALRHGWERIRIGDDLDETEYRLHHAKTYPGTNYDDFAPVYRYGNHVRRRNAFQGLGWDDAESALRAEWGRGHREGKPATWDELKAAMHHGWDQTTS